MSYEPNKEKMKEIIGLPTEEYLYCQTCREFSPEGDWGHDGEDKFSAISFSEMYYAVMICPVCTQKYISKLGSYY